MPGDVRALRGVVAAADGGADGRLRRLDVVVSFRRLFWATSACDARGLGRYRKKSRNSCVAYVAKKAKLCKEKVRDESGVSALEGCPATCGLC